MSDESATAVIGRNIREKIQARRRDADLIHETCDAVEDAWSEWDVAGLLQMQYISAHEAEAIEREIREATEADKAAGITRVKGSTSTEGLMTTLWESPSDGVLTFEDMTSN